VDTCRPAVRAVRPQLAEGRIGLAPSSVRQMMPGAQASATTVRATIAAIRRSPRPDARHSRPANDERGLRTQARSGRRSVWNLLPLIPRRSAATSAKIADVIVEFMNDDKGYVAWLAEHADGFVLNCERPPRPSYLTLHHASCWTISRTSGRNWTTNYQKVCADTFAEIHAWASQIGPLRSRGSSSLLVGAFARAHVAAASGAVPRKPPGRVNSQSSTRRAVARIP